MDANVTGCADYREVETSDVQIGEKLTLVV